MIRYRPLEWPRDRDGLARLDTSFVSRSTYAVRAEGLAFALEEREADPPVRKRYVLPVDELPGLPLVTVAERGGEVAGVAAVEVQGWNRRAVLAHLYVDPAARGRGIGAELVRRAVRGAAERGARHLWVETQNVNAPAIRFYQRLGFACCGLDTTLYDPRDAPGETAVFFARPLPPEESFPDRDDSRSGTKNGLYDDPG